jgi:hypothetical protein
MAYYSVNTNSDELYHHGVLGMKWGVRKDRRAAIKTAKKNRRLRDEAIQNQYNKAERSIEKPYKRGQLMSAKDNKRLETADSKARNDWTNSKKQYKSDVKSANTAYRNSMTNIKRGYGNRSYGKVAVKGVGRAIGAKVGAFTGFTAVGLAMTFGKVGEKQAATAIKVLGPTLMGTATVLTLKDAGQTYMNRKWSEEHLKKDY